MRLRPLQYHPMAFMALSLATLAPAMAQTVRLEAETFVNKGGGSAVSITGGSTGISVLHDTTVSEVDAQTPSGGAYIQYFATNGGSQNAGAEYVEYIVSLPRDGVYAVKARGAYAAYQAPARTDINLRFWNLSYGPVVDEPFDTLASGTASPARMTVFDLPNGIPFKAGDNRIRVYATLGGLTTDYFEFTRTGDLSGYGMVSGTVRADGQPVARAQVSADVPASPLLGFRALSNAQGQYSLLLPTGARTVVAAAPGYNDPAAAGASAPVAVTDGGTVTQNLLLTYNGKYETEWFEDATSGVGLSFDAVAVRDQSTEAPPVSWNQLVDNYDPGRFMRFTVHAPADGVYSILLRTAQSGAGRRVRMTLNTGLNAVADIPTSGSYTTFIDTTPFMGLPLKAGPNTLTLTHAGVGGLRNDYFILTPRAGEAYSTITGTIVAATEGGPRPLAGATVVVKGLDSSVVGATTSGPDGKYTLLMPADSYTLNAGAFRFASSQEESVFTSPGDSTVLNFTLTPQTSHLGPDVNGDQRLTREDASAIMRMASGAKSALTDGVDFARADTNNDQAITLLDALAAWRAIHRPAAWEFHVDGAMDGWVTSGDVAASSVSGGALNVTTGGAGFSILRATPDLNLDASQGLTVEIVMDSTADSPTDQPSQLYWNTSSLTTEDESRTLPFLVKSGLHTYHLRIPAQGEPIITQIRLDPLKVAGTVRIDSIRVLGGAPLKTAYAFEFEDAGFTEGWTPRTANVINMQVADGALSLQAKATDPGIEKTTGLWVDMSRGAKVEFTMETSVFQNTQVFFATDLSPSRTAQSMLFPIWSGKHTYTVALPPTPGYLNYLRLDPMASGNNDNPIPARIEYIRVYTP